MALAKHVVLKAPDRAEHRAIAADAAVQLTQMLPAQDQYAFVVFAACLSRSAKVSNTIDLLKLAEESTDCAKAWKSAYERLRRSTAAFTSSLHLPLKRHPVFYISPG